MSGDKLSFDKAHRLIKKADVSTLRKALEDGLLDPNLTNRFSWTVLMLSALEGNTRIGEMLLSYGADIHRQNRAAETALTLAAHKGHEPFVELLLRNGASADCRPHGWHLADWIEQTSGLSTEKIQRILNLLRIRSPSAQLH